MSGSIDNDIMTPDDSGDELLGMGSSSNNVPVGVTIAYKRQEKGFAHEEKIRHKTPDTGKSKNKRNKHHHGSSAKKKMVQEEPPRKKSTSFHVFLETSAIYALCVVLPTVIGYLYNSYHVWKYEQEMESEESSWTGGESESSYQWLSSAIYEPAADYVCQPDDGTSSYAWSLLSSAVAYSGLCPVPDEDENSSRSVLSDDVAAWSDVFTVAVCSFMLAAVRIAIVQYTVPMEDADDVEAMVRSKSVHLLSSDYSWTPVGTPVSKKPTANIAVAAAVAALPLPQMHPTMESNDDDMFGVSIDASEEHGDDPAAHLIPTSRLSPSFRPQQGTPPPRIQDGGAESEGLDPADLMQSLSEAAAEEPSKRSYAAPRFATALFRLLYSTAAAAIALIYFRNSEFWPWYCGGSGSTEKCWDLSGGLTVGMDSDYDQCNFVLKRYFLWQASYHWHSGAFHILSLLFLLLHPTKHSTRRFLSLKSSTSAYVRRLSQHGLAVALIAIAYVFSSLRRLVAIGVFAFDVSSWFLHLLQVCINSPEDSRLKSSVVIARVYWLLVIPSFVIARFFIWPSLWYSATYESTVWLTQLEKTLWPGAGALFRNIIHFLMVILNAFNVIYLRRLLTHPHLQGLLRRARQEDDE